MNTIPILSVIIPTKNEEKNIGRLIQSIIKSKSYSNNLIEIIVVDNPGTTDKTKKIALDLGVIVHEKGPERSTQRNFGAEKSNGDFLYFVDADMEFTDELLAEIFEKCLEKDQNIGYIIPERIPGKSLYCRAVNIEKQTYDQNEVISTCRIMSKKKFLEVGGYNVEMIMGEDWELDRRLRKMGIKMVFLENSILHHESDIGFFGSIQKKIYYARNFKKLNIGTSKEVSPFYRYFVMFSRPKLFFSDPIAYLFMIVLKSSQFFVGVCIVLNTKIKHLLRLD
jgi:glycosyltransferase involved in cell wall biosynthesis